MFLCSFICDLNHLNDMFCLYILSPGTGILTGRAIVFYRGLIFRIFIYQEE